MKLRVLIIEDEKPAQEHLERQLKRADPEALILAKLTTISGAVTWLENKSADIIFMDIHLADGSSFAIFDQVKVDIPIIFTTAYDAYALKAFKVNSIDYLLKPIGEEELKISLEKYRIRYQQHAPISVEELKRALDLEPKTFQERFMVNRGEKLLSVPTEQIAYFEGEDRYVYLVKKDGSRFIVDYRLSDLELVLNPNHFFRLNRSFITHITAIHSMVNLSKSRIKIELNPAAKRQIMVSSENSQEFKQWLNQ
jgi:two-component system, LytTR family, response regulator LytT